MTTKNETPQYTHRSGRTGSTLTPVLVIDLEKVQDEVTKGRLKSAVILEVVNEVTRELTGDKG